MTTKCPIHKGSYNANCPDCVDEFGEHQISIDHSEGELPVDGLLQEMGSTGNQEDQRTFSLQDMIDIHKEGAHNANVFCGYPSELNKYLHNCISDYMRRKFNIDILKQQ